MTAALDGVVVVIPVHDEEALLGRCLVAMDQARSDAARLAPDVPISVTVVLDECSDRSAAIAARFDVDVITVHARAVGSARSAGVTSALRDAAEPSAVWIANTDADSAVPSNWLTVQIDLARQGVDIMVGTVRPDVADLTDEQLDAWRLTHVPGVANGHVHGANLGIRADVYRRAGGFASVPEHEDVQLVERAVLAGARVEATDACWVLTSGRPVGRTPGGYAGYLRDGLLTRAEGIRLEAARAARLSA